MRIALLVDNPYRDLPGLVLTAMYLCQHGATCYLVPMNLRDREIWSLAPDFVLLHHLRTITQEFARELLQTGMEVGALDTEGGVLRSLEAYAKTMAPDVSVRHEIGCFCSWGSRLADYAVKKAWYLGHQVAVTGSPRFDFYVHPWREAALTVSPYADSFPKPMVLINGNFSIANPEFKTPEAEARMLVSRFGFDENEVLHWQQVQRETMLGMAELANNLAARLPQVTFVYRPHPFEKLETYTDLLDSRSNLHLIREGTVDGWILRASAVIQRSCSTAIEAGMAGVPALSPVWIPAFVLMETAESVSIPCQTEEDLISQLNAVLNGKAEIPDTIGDALDQVIADWFHKNDGKAHQRVGDCVLNILEKSKKQVRLARCRDKAYGRRRPDTPFKTRLMTYLRMKLGLPAGWSFRHWKDMTGEPAWDHSEKYFDAGQVKTLMTAILTCAHAESKEPLRKIGVQSAQEHGDYHFRYQQGRSVTVFLQ